jgi:hypothetical protein
VCRPAVAQIELDRERLRVIVVAAGDHEVDPDPADDADLGKTERNPTRL